MCVQSESLGAPASAAADFACQDIAQKHRFFWALFAAERYIGMISMSSRMGGNSRVSIGDELEALA